MIIQYDGEEDRNEFGQAANLIQDIYSRQAEPFIDVRNERVRHQALGALEQQYLYSRLKADDLPKQEVKGAYTRVPPLASFLSYEAADSHLKTILNNMKGLIAAASLSAATILSTANRVARRNLRKVGVALAGMRQAIVGAVLALIGWLAAIDISWLHSRYSVTAGVVSRPAKAVKGIKTAVPILLILFVVGLSIVGWITMPHPPRTTSGAQQRGGNQASSNGSHLTATHSKASLSSLKNSANKAQQPITAAPSPVAGGGVTSPTASPTITSGSNALPSIGVGGYGGGSVISPSPVPSTTVITTPTPAPNPAPTPAPVPAPAPLPSTTVTIPATSVSVGGQPLLTTGSTGISLP